MAAPEAIVNIYDASFAGTSLKRAVSLELHGVMGEVVSAAGDDDLFPTIVQVVGKRLKFDVRLMDVVGAVGLTVGDAGTVTGKLTALGTGSAQQVTISNAVCTGISATSAHGRPGEAIVHFEAASADGETSPLSIADVG